MSSAPCPRCGRAVPDPADLAAEADRLRAVMEGASAVAFTSMGVDLGSAYGGSPRHALRIVLKRAGELAAEHARGAACAAGRCDGGRP